MLDKKICHKISIKTAYHVPLCPHLMWNIHRYIGITTEGCPSDDTSNFCGQMKVPVPHHINDKAMAAASHKIYRN